MSADSVQRLQGTDIAPCLSCGHRPLRCDGAMGEGVWYCKMCSWTVEELLPELSEGERPTMSTAPWTRELWAEIERLRALVGEDRRPTMTPAQGMAALEALLVPAPEPEPELKEFTIWVVVDSDGSLLAWSCAPEGPDDAMAQAVADIMGIDPDDFDRPEGWVESYAAEVRARGVMTVTFQAATVEDLALAACALIGVEGHQHVQEWTERLQALRLNGEG